MSKTKKCRGCNRRRSIAKFNKSARSRDGLDRRCKDCARAYRATLQPVGFGLNRKWALSKRYGLTPEEYDRMEREQEGVCAICGDPPERSFQGRDPRLVVDHNHTTGKVRGLLCFVCNSRLSTVEDEQFMLLARAYLRRTDGFEFVNDNSALEANHPTPQGSML